MQILIYWEQIYLNMYVVLHKVVFFLAVSDIKVIRKVKELETFPVYWGKWKSDNVERMGVRTSGRKKRDGII